MACATLCVQTKILGDVERIHVPTAGGTRYVL